MWSTGCYIKKVALNAAYEKNDRHNIPVEVCVVGDRAAFIDIMLRHQITPQPTASLHQLMLLPDAHCGSAPR
ncbi:hypothetical protein [Candidatus Erwinia dacicola]|uniref:Uncharacterized protein n=1 Tax=Candidatus Erwinia dacicola TaxID=252393 RepID=A0A328TPT7_9GAMM|nr:hypothetical protein [Candidatus Erwinia dacicola]RAP70935.1 hypothetical protein ACZ87_02261 [Candidatus Erwinia dacicola]